LRVISGEAKGHALKAPKGLSTRPMTDKVKGSVFSVLTNLLARFDREWGRVLDLYSGSGSIGIEALSRGADWADFVEVNAGACRVVADNLEHTKFKSKARVNNRNVAAFLSSPPPPPGANFARRSTDGLQRRKGGAYRKRHAGALDDSIAVAQVETEQKETQIATDEADIIHNEKQYDIIFLDPPYADPKINDTLAHIARSGLAKTGGLVVIGHSPRVKLQDVYGEGSESGERLNLLRFRRLGDCAFSIFLAGNPADYGLVDADDEDEPEPELPDDSDDGQSSLAAVYDD
jgi:16S rRNA (guanine966-N2)-methyltransferase